MSSKNNVNKDFYTIAGRDRPNEDLVMTTPPRDAARGPRGASRQNFIPGAAPVGESSAQTSAGKTGVRSGAQKAATARRGGAAPGKARPKAGAFGDSRGRKSTTTAARGTGATATPKRRASPARRSRGRRAA